MISAAQFAEYRLRVGENLERARLAARLSQPAASKGIVTPEYYRKLEAGRTNTTLWVLAALASRVGVTVAALTEVDPAATRLALERMVSVQPIRRGRKPR